MATNQPLTVAQVNAAMQTGITICPGSAHPPPDPAIGACYFNTTTQVMMVWTGTSWCQLTAKQPPWALFLDDERMPSDANFVVGTVMVLVARTVEQAQQYVKDKGLPMAISFDHDLGEGQPPATSFAWWLINGHLDGLWDCKEIGAVQVHSANPEGGRNIFLLWEGFCREHDIGCKINRVKAIQR